MNYSSKKHTFFTKIYKYCQVVTLPSKVYRPMVNQFHRYSHYWTLRYEIYFFNIVINQYPEHRYARLLEHTRKTIKYTLYAGSTGNLNIFRVIFSSAWLCQQSSLNRNSSIVRRPSVRLWHRLSLKLLHGFLSNFSCGFPWAICPDVLKKKCFLIFTNIFRFR